MTKILVLNDSQMCLAFFHDVLSSAGYESITATNDEDALAILRTRSVDLFIQDIERPTGSGEELLRLLKSDAALSRIPVLVASGTPRDVCARRLKELGLDIDRDVDGYLEMPFKKRELLDAIESVLQKYRKP